MKRRVSAVLRVALACTVASASMSHRPAEAVVGYVPPVVMTPAEVPLPMRPDGLPAITGPCRAFTLNSPSSGNGVEIRRFVIDRDTIIATVFVSVDTVKHPEPVFLFAQVDDGVPMYVRPVAMRTPFDVGFGDLKPGKHWIVFALLDRNNDRDPEAPNFAEGRCITIGTDRRSTWPRPTPTPHRP